MARKMIFRQLFDRNSCTYTYLLGDVVSKEALLIDPVLELVPRDLSLISELGLKLRYLVNTHVHADHITGSGEIKDRLNEKAGNSVVSIISAKSGARADVHLTESQVITCGESINLHVLSTPGHTNGCMTLVDHENAVAFTGDALLIRGCGRTDFQNGSAEILFNSIHEKIFTLPDHYTIYPAHDYKGLTSSTVGEEKVFNSRLIRSKEEFITLMGNLNLDYPKMIDIAVPRNMVCGYQDCE